MKAWSAITAVLLVLCLPVPARAQIRALSKGFLLERVGSLTSLPGEVITGGNSVKGASTGSDATTYHRVLATNVQVTRLVPGQTYTVTASYRVLSAAATTFEIAFHSAVANGQGVFLPGITPTAPGGSSGTATATAPTGSYADVRVAFSIVGNGAIAFDDIRITDSSGQLIASENAEGPALAPGGLGFQLTHATAMLTDAGATIRSSAVRDLDRDGYPEVLLTLTAPRPSTTPLSPLAISARNGLTFATPALFPAGAPMQKHSALTLFADVNHDGFDDILFGEAGSDAPPWQGSGMGVALHAGVATYQDVSPLIPLDLQPARSYALAAGDIDSDGRADVVLLDQNGSRHALLHWNGSGFDADRNWLPESLWGYPGQLAQHSWTLLEDFDRDGRQDLLVSGQFQTPNLRVLFGAPGGASPLNLVELPDGPFGHAGISPSIVTQGANPEPVVAADFNDDGLPDLFSIHELVVNYPPGTFTDTSYPGYEEIRRDGGVVPANYALQVLMNRGARRFEDVSSASSTQILGRRKYTDVMVVDLNDDGFPDVLGVYQTQYYAGVAPVWGSTIFFNDGTGAFDVVDGTRFLAATTTPSNGQVLTLGAFVPTRLAPSRIEGVVFESVGSCAVGFCAPAGLNLYRVAADRGIGTGPGFQDSAALGVPGFNEFYYLRHYPDAADAVQNGEYPSGLAHYLAVGRDRNYRPFAPGARVLFTDADLESRATPIKLAHIVELRSRINLLRAAYGLVAFPFTDSPLVARQTTIKAVHLLELRNAVIEAYVAALRAAPMFSETITGTTVIRADHIRELRQAVLGLE